MINDDYTPPNEHRRTQHKACIPILFICCECGTIASLWGGGVKVAAFREDTGKIMWKSAETKVVLLFQLKNRQNQKPKAELRLAQMTESDAKLVYFTSKELVSFFYFSAPKTNHGGIFFSVFLLCQMKRRMQKSNSQVNKCHRQPTALHYCLLHVFTFAAFNKWRPNVTSRKLLWNCSDWRDLSFFFHSSPMNANIMLENLKVSQWMRVRYRRGLYRSKS